MSAARLGKNWADVDEDDEDEVVGQQGGQGARCFETPVDANGMKSVIEYKERDGKTYKVIKRVQVSSVTKWTNTDMQKRQTMEKFGKAKTNDRNTEASLIQQSQEEVNIEVCKKVVQLSQAAEAEDKFYEEALRNCENLFKVKKVWTDVNKDKQIDREGGAPAPDAAAAAAAPAAAAAEPEKPGQPAKYVPPSIKAAMGKGGGKGGLDAQQDASLRVTNLSEDVKEGDLQDLFGAYGRLQRVYLAKDQVTFLSKGFAFITYYTRADAQRAMDKLNGHGYDNLIMQVMWAKPKA